MLHIPKIRPHLRNARAISLRIAIRQKMRITVVRMQNAMRVPDRAPVLLGAGRDFHHVSHQPIAIRAVSAINALRQIQITQFPASKMM